MRSREGGMKSDLLKCALGLLLLGVGGERGFCQAFTNLNFESAQGPNGNQPGVFPVATALPGWSVYYGTYQDSQISFNAGSSGTTQVELVGSNNPEGPYGNAIEGNYGIYFLGGEGATDGSIRQTGLIPAGTMSIEFKARGDPAYGPILLSFGGQNIPEYALATGPNYTLYGGDVSGLAGTTGQLEFSVPGSLEGYPFNNWFLDSIVFSLSPVPEPGTLAMLGGWRGAPRVAAERGWGESGIGAAPPTPTV
jgi:hypothetical protein